MPFWWSGIKEGEKEGSDKTTGIILFAVKVLEGVLGQCVYSVN